MTHGDILPTVYYILGTTPGKHGVIEGTNTQDVSLNGKPHGVAVPFVMLDNK
jgi:hypothetical protein